MSDITHVDYLIIGAGPAGLQLGYFLEKANRNYLILEAEQQVGNFFTKFPRHRQLISINKVHTGYSDTEVNLRWDWNSLLSDDDDLLFKRYSRDYFPGADEFVTYCQDYAERFNLRIKYNTSVVQVSKDEVFRVQDEAGNTYIAKRLIIATGLFQPYVPEIPGIELAESYTTVDVNPEEFMNQRVLVIGKGNSGFETADNLVGTTSLLHVASPAPLNFAWKTHFVGHLRAVNNNFLDTYQLKSQNAILDASIKKIRRQDGQYVVSVSYSHADGEEEDLVYDRVIACTGFRFDASIFDDSCKPQLAINERFPDQTNEWESTTIEDLYFAGALMQMRDYKKTTSAFIHGFRYNVKALHRIFETKYHDVSWPNQPVEQDVESIVNAIVQRTNNSSALWQQFGFLCDLMVFSRQDNQMSHYEEMPMDYIFENVPGKEAECYVLSLEFGKITGDPFKINRQPNPDQAQQATFLHPVIRYFSRGTLVDEHHVLEDLYGEWYKEDAHIQPLRDFIRSTFNGGHPEVTANGNYRSMNHQKLEQVVELVH